MHFLLFRPLSPAAGGLRGLFSFFMHACMQRRHRLDRWIGWTCLLAAVASAQVAAGFASPRSPGRIHTKLQITARTYEQRQTTSLIVISPTMSPSSTSNPPPSHRLY